MKDAIFLVKKTLGIEIDLFIAFSQTEKGLGEAKLTIVSATQVL